MNDAESEPESLKWSWRPENIDEAVVLGRGQHSQHQIVDQKIDNDVSDYMWYMTSVNLDKNDPIWSDDMTLRVNGSGHILHAYVNGQYLGVTMVSTCASKAEIACISRLQRRVKLVVRNSGYGLQLRWIDVAIAQLGASYLSLSVGWSVIPQVLADEKKSYFRLQVGMAEIVRSICWGSRSLQWNESSQV